MTMPVETDDIVQGCVKYLLDEDNIHRVLGVYPEMDTPFLFAYSLWTRIEGTQSTAAVIALAGGWGAANTHNTMRFPRLSLEIYVDPLRDELGHVTNPGESHRRAMAAYEVFDSILHRPAPETVYWGTIRTIGCTRTIEPNIFSLPDGDGMIKLQTFYAVTQA